MPASFRARLPAGLMLLVAFAPLSAVGAHQATGFKIVNVTTTTADV